MTQPAPAGPPTSAPPAPTQAPPAGAPPTGQPPQPTGTPVQPPQQGWPQQQAPQGYQQPSYPQAPPVQYVPVMPIPPTLAQPAPGSGENGSGEGGEADLSKLPQWAQRQMQQLRDENAKRRVTERTAVVNQHAWVAAQQLGVNGQALFGSLAWQQAAEKLDPSSPDFGRHLAEMIHTTLRDNPWMAAQQAYPPPVPGQPAPPGTPGQGQPPAPGTPLGQPGQPPQGGYPGQPGYPPPQPYPPYPGALAGYPPAYPPQPGYPGQPYGAPQPPPGWLRPPTSGAEFAAGNVAGAPITEAQLAQMTPEQISEALEKGQLKHLM